MLKWIRKWWRDREERRQLDRLLGKDLRAANALINRLASEPLIGSLRTKAEFTTAIARADRIYFGDREFARELGKEIDRTEISPLREPPAMRRQAHETYKIGSCTVRVLGSKAEQQMVMAQHRADADESLATRKGRLNDAGGGALARGLTEDQILDLIKRGEAEEAVIAGPTVAPPSGKTK